MAYILYKNPEQYDTLAIVQYLHSIGKQNTPTICIERNYPEWVTELPSICTHDNKTYSGYHAVVRFYEERSGIQNLQQIANEFKEKYPNYTINKTGGR